MQKEKRTKSREPIMKIMTLLWREEVDIDIYKTEFFWGQSFYIDLSANSDEPKLIMKTILQQVYKLGEEDWTFKLKEEIKDLL